MLSEAPDFTFASIRTFPFADHGLTILFYSISCIADCNLFLKSYNIFERSTGRKFSISIQKQLLNFLRLYDKEEKGRENFSWDGWLGALFSFHFITNSAHYVWKKCHVCLGFFFPFRTSQKSSWLGAITDIALGFK